MYLRFDTRLEFPELAVRLHSDLTEDSLDWDSENVYEWMYVDLPQLPFSLNVSREHGWADVDDEILIQHENDSETLKQIVQPGPVYVMGWNRHSGAYVDDLPDDLPRLFANQLEVEVAVFSGRLNLDADDEEPILLIKPNSVRR